MTVTPSPNFIGQIQQVLKQIGAPQLRFGAKLRLTAKIDAVYETFLYFLLVDVAKQAAGTVTAELHNGKFVVRLQHGEMKSTKDTFSYVRFFLNREYELHIDTFVSCRPRDTRLEVDIGLFSAGPGTRARAGRSDRPTYRSLWLFVEAKYLGKNVSTTLAKAFIGTWSMLGRPQRSWAALVANRGIDGNASRLVEGGGCRSYGRVLPLRSCQANVSKWADDARARLKRLP